VPTCRSRFVQGTAQISLIRAIVASMIQTASFLRELTLDLCLFQFYLSGDVS
jgi:hypothetical protein